jgi:hypothetical protein
MFNSELGLRLARDPETGRGVSLFLEYAAGRQPQGQFYLNRETHWGFGLKFEFS